MRKYVIPSMLLPVESGISTISKALHYYAPEGITGITNGFLFPSKTRLTVDRVKAMCTHHIKEPGIDYGTRSTVVTQSGIANYPQIRYLQKKGISIRRRNEFSWTRTRPLRTPSLLMNSEVLLRDSHTKSLRRYRRCEI